MALATISNSGGPGSSIQLAPETIRVRDVVIERCESQTLEQMNDFVKSLLQNETDELKRLGILAARVFILRQRIQTLSVESQIVNAKDLLKGSIVANTDERSDPAKSQPIAQSGWTRLNILKECEINEVRFFSGSIVDVRTDDADALIKSGDAKMLQESDPVTQAAAAKKDNAETPPAKTKPNATPDNQDVVITKTLEASSRTKPDKEENALETRTPVAPTESIIAEKAVPADLGTSFEDSSNSDLSDEERADEAMEAIFAAADKQEKEMAEAAAKAAAEAEAAEKAAAEAEVAARGIIDDTEVSEPEAEAEVSNVETQVQVAESDKEAPKDTPAELDAVEIGVDSSDLEELAAFAGLTGEPVAPKGSEDDQGK